MARPSKLNYWLTEGRTALESILTSYKTDREIMAALGINKTTLYRWKEENKTFRELYEAKRTEFKEKLSAVRLEEAESNLAKLIKGDAEEVTTTEELKMLRDGDEIVPTMVITKRVTRKVPPNVTAIIFALKNLDPAKWKDRPVGDDGSQDEDNKINELLDKISEGVSTNASNK